MKKTNKAYKKNKKEKLFTRKISRLGKHSTPFLKLSLALALFIITALFISGAGVIVENGALNISNNLVVNTTTLFVDSTNNRVGISTISPNDILEVVGNVRISGHLNTTNLNASRLYARNGTVSTPSITFIEETNTGVIKTSEDNLTFVTGGNNRLTIDSSGNVGIGTTSSQGKLQVKQSSDVNLLVNTVTSGHITISAVNDANSANIPLELRGSNVVVTTGNVGIGTASPEKKLAISPGEIQFTSQTANELGLNDIGWIWHTSGPSVVYRGNNKFIVKGNTSGSFADNLIVDISGNVGIGTESPASALTVIGNFSATGTKSAVINTSQGVIAFYAMESSEVRLYDEGRATLSTGSATISLDPIFAEVIDSSDYIVYITPKGSSNGLYVEQQTPTSFAVKENNGGTSNIEFNYLISGKRKEFKDVRNYKINNFDFGNMTKN